MASRLIANITSQIQEPRLHISSSWPTIAILALSIYIVYSLLPEKSKYPSVNYNNEWTYIQAKLNFVSNAKRLITQGFQRFAGPFSIVTDGGPLIMLPPEYIDAVNQEPKLNFQAFTEQVMLSIVRYGYGGR